MTRDVIVRDICDRCARTLDRYVNRLKPHPGEEPLSPGWRTVAIRRPDVPDRLLDLCPECAEAFDAWSAGGPA